MADADAARDRALELGATLVDDLTESNYTRTVTVRDPQGAGITLSQYVGPQ